MSWLERFGEKAELRHRRVPFEGLARTSHTVGILSAARATGVPQLLVSDGNVFIAFTDAGKVSRIRVVRYDLGSMLLD